MSASAKSEEPSTWSKCLCVKTTWLIGHPAICRTSWSIAAASASVVPVSTSSAPVRPRTSPMVTSQNGSRQRCTPPVSCSHAKYTERKVAPHGGLRKYDSLMASRSPRKPSRWIVVAAAAIVFLVAASTWVLLHRSGSGRPAGASPSSTSPARPNGTQVTTVVAVDANGQPVNGYREVPTSEDPSNVTNVFDCDVSPAAVANDIYYCAPDAAGADVCWPSTPGTLLCLDDPWDKEVCRVAYAGPLSQVQPTPGPAPFALFLDDGTRCRLRNGGAWDVRDDGLVGAYGCPNETPAVLVPVTPKAGESAIDRSQPLWTVKVGSLGGGEPHLPPPQTRTVTTAWFAGTSGPT